MPEPVKRRSGASEAYREMIELELSRGRNAMGIWQDLVDKHGFTSSYQSVQRFVLKLRGAISPEARVIIETKPGEEAQVDYGTGPLVREVLSRESMARFRLQGRHRNFARAKQHTHLR